MEVNSYHELKKCHLCKYWIETSYMERIYVNRRYFFFHRNCLQNFTDKFINN